MKTLTSSTSATEFWGRWPAIAGLLVAVCLQLPLSAGTQRQELVKILAKPESSRIMYKGKLMPSRVLEVIPTLGAVLDDRGLMVSYFGDHWRKLAGPGAEFAIERRDGRRFPAKLVGIDERMSVGVLYSPGVEDQGATLGGTLERDELQFTALSGGEWREIVLHVVRIKEREPLPLKEMRACPHDASKNNVVLDGSAVTDKKGRFLGLVTYSERSFYSENIDTYRIIPADQLLESVALIVDQKKTPRAGWLGITLKELNSDDICVGSVVASSPAEKAGLMPGDVILEVNGKPTSLREIGSTIRWQGPGSRITVTVERGGLTETLHPVLGEIPRERDPVMGWVLEVPRVWNGSQSEGASGEVKLYPKVLPAPLSLGFVVEPITPQLAKVFKCPSSYGLWVKEVVEGSLAGNFGFAAGDVMLRINQVKMVSPADIQVALDQARDGLLEIKFIRDGKTRTQVVSLN